MTARVFLWIDPISPLLQPAHVTRHEGMTGIVVDPKALRAELAAWAIDNLTDEERQEIRYAFDQPEDLAIPIADALLDGRVATLVIPEHLALPEHVALPRGRRRAAAVPDVDLEALWRLPAADVA